MSDSQKMEVTPEKTDSCIGYQPMPIHPLLAPYIESIEVELPHINFTQPISPYRIFPGLSVVMGFQYQGELDLLTHSGDRIRLQRCGMTGLLTNYKNFQPASACTKTILVRLYPWGIPVFFNESAHQLTDQSLGLTDIIKADAVHNIEEKLQGIKDPSQLSDIIQEFFIQLYSVNGLKRLPQSRIIHIAQNLSSNATISSIESFARHYGYSKRSLERHFQTTIGISPKRFILTARFQKILNLLKMGNDWEIIAEHFAYYDQSHFIKDIKQFTGLTPSQLTASFTSS